MPGGLIRGKVEVLAMRGVQQDGLTRAEGVRPVIPLQLQTSGVQDDELVIALHARTTIPAGIVHHIAERDAGLAEVQAHLGDTICFFGHLILPHTRKH